MDNKGIKITNHGETSVFVAISDGDKKTRASAKSLEVKPGQTITAGAAKGGMNDSNSSDLAQAGVRAELAAPVQTAEPFPEHWRSRAEWIATTKELGQEERGRIAVMLLRTIVAAPTTPAQVPAAEVRAQALEEAAKIALRYVGCEGIAERIRSLAQSSTADKASEVRAAELTAEDVQWVTNDNAELGVKIGNQFFFLYKGGSLIYEQGKHDDGSAMYWRPVFKREFGECAHPINYENPHLIGTVSLSDSDEWKMLPTAPSTADSGNTGALGEGADQ